MTDPMTKLTIKDAEGNPHAYEIKPIPTTRAIPLVLNILAAGAGPLARLIEQWVKIENEVDSNEEAMELVMERLDWGELSQDLQTALLSFAEKPKLVRSLFEGSWRDGADLSVDRVYDTVYAGNWKEWYVALFKIVQVNGFLASAASFLTTPGTNAE